MGIVHDQQSVLSRNFTVGCGLPRSRLIGPKDLPGRLCTRPIPHQLGFADAAAAKENGDAVIRRVEQLIESKEMSLPAAKHLVEVEERACSLLATGNSGFKKGLRMFFGEVSTDRFFKFRESSLNLFETSQQPFCCRKIAFRDRWSI